MIQAHAPGFSLDQLQVLVNVVDHGSFSAAARKMGRTQPAISQTVHALEAQLGYALFDRGAYRPALTPRGQAFVPHARRLLGEAEALRSAARAIAQDRHTLTLSLDHSAPLERVAAAIARLNGKHAGLELSCNIEPLDRVAEQVMCGAAEVGMLSHFAVMPDGLNRAAVGHSRIVLLAGADHPLAALPLVTMADLRAHVQLVLTATDGHIASRGFGLVGGRVWKLGSLSVLRALLRGNTGFAIMPEHHFAEQLARGELIAPANDVLAGRQDAESSSFLVWRADVPPSPIAHAFLESMNITIDPA
ncbi:MAG: HTH-type transcriptional activator AllS [Pseudomonadota bacterium]|jgi:DNA-binding transcriptional LysR family regulator